MSKQTNNEDEEQIMIEKFAVAYSKVKSPNETMLIAQSAMRSALSTASKAGTFHITYNDVCAPLE